MIQNLVHVHLSAQLDVLHCLQVVILKEDEQLAQVVMAFAIRSFASGLGVDWDLQVDLLEEDDTLLLHTYLA